MPATVSRSRSAEAERVRRWRVAQLVQAGYSRADAHRLSRRDDVDLHVAVQLLAAGCPPKTALRILL